MNELDDNFLYELREVPPAAFREALRGRLSSADPSRWQLWRQPVVMRTATVALGLLVLWFAMPQLRGVLRADAAAPRLKQSVTITLDEDIRYKVSIDSVEPDFFMTEVVENEENTCWFENALVSRAELEQVISFRMPIPESVPSHFGTPHYYLSEYVDSCHGDFPPQHDGQYQTENATIQWRDSAADPFGWRGLEMYSFAASQSRGPSWAFWLKWFGIDAGMSFWTDEHQGLSLEMFEVNGRRVGVVSFHATEEAVSVTRRQAFWYQDGAVHQLRSEMYQDELFEGEVFSAEQLLGLIESAQ